MSETVDDLLKRINAEQIRVYYYDLERGIEYTTGKHVKRSKIEAVVLEVLSKWLKETWEHIDQLKEPEIASLMSYASQELNCLIDPEYKADCEESERVAAQVLTEDPLREAAEELANGFHHVARGCPEECERCREVYDAHRKVSDLLEEAR